MFLIKNPSETGQQAANGFISRSLIIIISFGVVLLTSVAIAIYFYVRYQQTQQMLTNSTQSGEQAALVAKVGKLIVLPSGEQPNVATVSDINKLKGQPFFANARNGDKVLIYSRAQEAILYDPLVNKIVAVGPIALTQATPSLTGVQTAQLSPMRVVISNGTDVIGFASSSAKDLEEKFPSMTVVAKTDAQKSTYTKTLIVDLTGKNATQAAILAKALNAKVIPSVPAGETKPTDADILIILGK